MFNLLITMNPVIEKIKYNSSLMKNKYLLIMLILLAVAIRLININAPIIGKQSWRQADTAAISRNFVEEEFNILYPRIDWRGTTSGYVETEFPIYGFIVACFYKMFGIHEWIGRALSIGFSLGTMFFLYFLIGEISGKNVALWSMFFYAILPMSIFYSRTIMPESLMLMGCTGCVYCFFKWYKTDKLIYLLISNILLSIAVLIKPPTLYIGLPLSFLAFRKYRFKALFQVKLWIFSILIIIPFILWYYHSHQLKIHTGLSFGIWEYGIDKWGNWDLVFSLEFWKKILIDHISKKYLVIYGIPPLITALLITRNNQDERIFYFCLLAMFVYIIIVAKGNYVHDYLLRQ